MMAYWLVAFLTAQVLIFFLLYYKYKKGLEKSQESSASWMQWSEHFHQQMQQYQHMLSQQMQQMQITLQQQQGQQWLQTQEHQQKLMESVTERIAKLDLTHQQMGKMNEYLVQLQTLLSDKRARGALGETQLMQLIRDQLPEQNFRYQHTLSNGSRVDCLLVLPSPIGSLAIDSKFPLENYQIMQDGGRHESERQKAQTSFKQDVRKHLQDIHKKYINPPETAHSAMMFLPAESIFATIHSQHEDLVTLAHTLRVWIVSPSTMMAILTTLRALLQDAKTYEEMDDIKKQLQVLASDFQRFHQRMNQLSKHIQQASQDTQEIYTSSNKIVHHFNKITSLDLTNEIT